MSGCNNKKCIQAENVNITLMSVFEFIRKNQVTASGYLIETVVFLKLSLTEIQSPLSKERKSASNIVYGFVTSVTNTYVVLLARTNCEDIYSEYTIEYSKIIEVINGNFSNRYNQFVEYLDELPELCYEEDNQYLDMLVSLEEALIKYKDDKTKGIKIIFDGVNSRLTINNEVVIIKNFVLVENLFLFPITTIGGYIITPVCNNTEELSTKELADNIHDEKGGVLNV